MARSTCSRPVGHPGEKGHNLTEYAQGFTVADIRVRVGRGSDLKS